MAPQPPVTVPLIHRRLLLGGLAALAASAAHAACPPPRVLFVCPAGTVKSAIARERLRREAAEAGVAVEVFSRGLHPEDHVSQGLAEALKRDGVDPAAEPALPLSPGDLARADLVIAFDEAARAPGLESARAWVTPSWNTDYAAAKADLDGRLAGLLEELRRRSLAPCPAG
jgi:protein-tyrosine-phosphatase